MGGQLLPRFRYAAMEISNLRKAAVFLRCLPEDQVAMLLKILAPDQALAVSAEMAGLVEISADEQEAMVQEFADASATKMEASRADESPPFQFLGDIGAKELLALLGNEHPQTMALVLSHLPAEQAAETLAALPPDTQASVIRRIAAMNPPSREIVHDVEQCLQCRLTEVKIREARGMASVVKMLGAMRPAAERRLLGDSPRPTPTCSARSGGRCLAPTWPPLRNRKRGAC